VRYLTSRTLRQLTARLIYCLRPLRRQNLQVLSQNQRE